MTTTADRPARRNPIQDRIKKVVNLAEQAGCQLRPGQAEPTILRGLCPFHFSMNTHTQNTLRIDARKGTFGCRVCHVNGTMTTFAAMLWEISIPEAFSVIESSDSLSLDRPVPVSMAEPERSADFRFRAQNSYLLTKATQYYAGKLARSHEAVAFLSRLGISMAQTEAMKIGYCDGWGLIPHLRRADVSEEEIVESTLIEFAKNGNPTERYERTLAIPNLDTAGSTSWMTMIYPAAPDLHEEWEPRPHRPISIWGRRPYMLGLLAVGKNEPAVCITDDIRVYLVAKAQGAAALYTMGREQPEQLEKTAARIHERDPRHLTVACYDQNVAKGIADSFRSVNQNKATTRVLTTEQTLLTLEPSKRDPGVFFHRRPQNQPGATEAEPARQNVPAMAQN